MTSNWRCYHSMSLIDPKNDQILLDVGCTWTCILSPIWYWTERSIEVQGLPMEAPEFYTCTVKIWKLNKWKTSMSVSDNELPQFSNRKSCSGPYMRQKHRPYYAIRWFEAGADAQCTRGGGSGPPWILKNSAFP
jgi:hypothetical protein